MKLDKIPPEYTRKRSVEKNVRFFGTHSGNILISFDIYFDSNSWRISYPSCIY